MNEYRIIIRSSLSCTPDTNVICQLLTCIYICVGVGGCMLDTFAFSDSSPDCVTGTILDPGNTTLYGGHLAGERALATNHCKSTRVFYYERTIQR